MEDPIYLPPRRGHRTKVMQNLPHPSNAHRLQITGTSLTSGDLFVAQLGPLADGISHEAQNILLELLSDALTHGYLCATADIRRLMNYGSRTHG